MKILTTTLASGLLALGLSAGLALAQAPAPGAATPAPGATLPPGAKPAVSAPAKSVGAQKTAQTPEGIECSKQADAKNLHGKERIKFRAKCKSDLKKAAKAAASPAPASSAPASPTGVPAKKN